MDFSSSCCACRDRALCSALCLLVSIACVAPWTNLPCRAQSLPSGPAGASHVSGDTTTTERPSASRAALWRERREQKARAMQQTPDPSWLQRVGAFLRQTSSVVRPNQVLLDLPSSSVAGLRPAFGSLGSNAVFPVGLHYEPHALNGLGHTSHAQVLTSLNQYWGAEVIHGRDLGSWVGYAYGRYRHSPAEEFYGIGPDSRKAHESVYRLNEAVAGALAGRVVTDNMLVGSHLSYRADRYGTGMVSGEVQRLDSQFSENLPPGTGLDVDYAMVGAFFEYDGRSTPYERGFGRRFSPTEHRLRTISLDAERGLYLASELTHHVDATHNQYSFTRLTVDAQQYVPLEKEAMHGLALRQFASFTRAPGGQEVPFYRLQSLGGSRSLRGYYTDRFRDRNVLLLNAEVRCHVWHWLDMALFTDAGHVFRDANELGLEGIRYDVGIGFRVRANNKTLGRFEIARSPEGLVTHLELGSLL